MKPNRTIAALAAGALLTWGSAYAAPEAPEAMQEVPVIILELQPGSEADMQEQALMAMLLLQLMLGAPVEAEAVPVQPAPVKAAEPGQRI